MKFRQSSAKQYDGTNERHQCVNVQISQGGSWPLAPAVVEINLHAPNWRAHARDSSARPWYSRDRPPATPIMRSSRLSARLSQLPHDVLAELAAQLCSESPAQQANPESAAAQQTLSRLRG